MNASNRIQLTAAELKEVLLRIAARRRRAVVQLEAGPGTAPTAGGSAVVRLPAMSSPLNE
ncbi:MAG TPA: hypothetical protein DCY13_14605 [Verrucomicrobiales bacterium]|nr:hypothetical protein [Verrucomicrobiales bacterium]